MLTSEKYDSCYAETEMRAGDDAVVGNASDDVQL